MKLKNGYKIEINQEVLESWEFVEILADIEENPLKSVKLMKMLLGKEQMEGLIDHLGGNPKASDMFDILQEILEGLGKNSKN